MSAKIKYEKLPTQAKVFDDDVTRIIMQSMGLGGGKTYNLCMKLLKLSAQNPNCAGGLLCPSFADFQRDVLPTMESILEKNRVKYRYHKTYKTFHFPWSKKPLYCFSAEKPIAGPNLGYCGINEFSLIPYVRISEMLRRVRVKEARNMQSILVGTPEDVYGWLDEYIENQLERGPEQFQIHYGGSAENTYISDDYVKELESMLDEEALKVFRDGQLGRMGSDYFYYAFDRPSNVSADVGYDKNLPIYVGMDFNVGRMALTFSHKVNDTQLFFDEKLFRGDSNTEMVARELKDIYPKAMMTIICDASGANRSTAARGGLTSDVAILKDAGYNVEYRRSNPRLRQRQLQMNGMLEKKRILMHPKCKGLINDIKNVRQKENFIKNETSDHSMSHFSDCLDYTCSMLHNFEVMDRKTVTYQL